MVNKDWSLVSNRNGVIHWGKNYDKISGNLDLSLFVAHQTYNKEAWGYNKPSEWIVELDNKKTSTTLKSFKTKAQAMNHAKSYMRSH